MADNVTLNAGSSGVDLATDENTGDTPASHYQRVKITDGTDGAFTNHLGIYAEDAAHTTGDTGIQSLAVRKDTAAALSGTDGDYTPLITDSTGRLHANVSNTVTVDGSGVTQPVSGTVTANLSATDNAVLDQLEVNTSYGDNTGNGTATGSLRVTIASDTTGVLSIDDNGAALTVDNGGTFAVQAASAGDAAHDAADSGNPVKIGAKATNSIEGLTQVAANDRTDVRADLNGVLITRPHTTLEEILTERVSDTAGTSTAFTNFAAGGAGVHNYITTIAIYNSSATDGYVDFRDGTAGSIIFTAPAPTLGGSVINLPVPLKGAANTALAYDVSGALSTVYISVVGFQAQG